jgi:hypothetical protein
MPRRLAKKRHFDLARFRVREVILPQKPVPIIEREHPRRVGPNLVAVTLRLENARELYVIAQVLLKPLGADALILAIQSESPSARKWEFNCSQAGAQKHEADQQRQTATLPGL